MFIGRDRQLSAPHDVEMLNKVDYGDISRWMTLSTMGYRVSVSQRKWMNDASQFKGSLLIFLTMALSLNQRVTQTSMPVIYYCLCLPMKTPPWAILKLEFKKI